MCIFVFVSFLCEPDVMCIPRFFFKQKTAYEMRISDWSSDVCSSDLDAFIGLTIVAIGTSAPELVTTIISTIRDERDIAIGNLIGRSVYNILVILGVTCLIPADRSEERRVGKASVVTCRSRWSTDH